MVQINNLSPSASEDLIIPAIAGARLTQVVCSGLSIIFSAIIPGVLDLHWNAEQFFNLSVFGLPIEELLYAFNAVLKVV